MIGFTSANSDKASSAAFGNDSSLILIFISSGIIGTAYFIYLVAGRGIRAYIDRFKFKNNSAMGTIILTALVICNFNNLLFYILWIFPIFVLLNLKKEEIEEDTNDGIFRIGIDARGLNKNKAGIPTYIEEIVKYFNSLVETKTEYILYSNRKIEISENLKENIIVKENKAPKMIGTLWLYFSLPKILNKDKVNVFFGTQHCLPERNEYTEKIKFVLTIHDLAISKIKGIGSFGNTLIQKAFVKRSLKSADEVIAISNSTKKDIMDIYKIDEKKIHVIYNGAKLSAEKNISEEEEGKIIDKFKIENSKYLFFLSTIEPRKNVETLIKAFDFIKDKGAKDLKLILARRTWLEI